jgi:tRNA A37 threonylcarbamoyladenosine modification protein TsaB
MLGEQFLGNIFVTSILSIYADNDFGYAALSMGEKMHLRKVAWTKDAPQSVGFLPLIANVVEDAAFSDNLDVIIAPRGPSSFTTLRTTLTIAKAFAFSSKNSTIFAPSRFHVLAFAAREEISRDTAFLVLLDAFNHGFYGAVCLWNSNENSPRITHEPQFYDKTDGSRFLKQHHCNTIITDFTPKAKCLDFLTFSHFNVIQPFKNFAAEQTVLYQCGVEDDFDCSTLTPFYLYSPAFKKMDERIACSS